MSIPQRSLPTVLVTGGYGRLGRLLVEELRNRGHRVVSLARARTENAHVDDIAVDLTDPDLVQRVMCEAGADVVVHLASVLRGGELEDTNRKIDLAVAAATRAARVRTVVHASSGAVYGVAGVEPRDGLSPLDGSTPYARSKIHAEQVFRCLADECQEVSIVSLRIFNIAGPSFPDSLVQRLIRAKPSNPARVTTPDKFIRDYVHQDDVVKILCLATEYSDPGARIVNVGAGKPVSTRMLLEGLGVAPSCVEETAGEPSSNWADVSRMIRMFGVLPRNFPDGAWD